MHLFLPNVIPPSLIEESLALVPEDHSSSEYILKESEISFHLTQFLHSILVEEAAKQWAFQKYKFSKLKIKKSSTGSFNKRHTDFVEMPLNQLYLNFAIALNDDFEGGEFIFENPDHSRIGFELTKGNGLLFEATNPREILHITKGERFSLMGYLIIKQ